MLRVIVHHQDQNAAAHVDNAKTEHSYKTFDIIAPELEQFLRNAGTYATRQVIGVEIVDR